MLQDKAPRPATGLQVDIVDTPDAFDALARRDVQRQQDEAALADLTERLRHAETETRQLRHEVHQALSLIHI